MDDTAAGSTVFFRAEADATDETLYPLPASASGWAPDQIRGMAVSGALARATERTANRDFPSMRPVRWSVELFRPARVRPTTVATTIIRTGRRIGIIDSELFQQGRPVARSRAIFVRPSPTPAGAVWQPDHSAQIIPPPIGLTASGEEARLFCSDDTVWTDHADAHANASRKKIWQSAIVLVGGEQPTPFQTVAAVADVASLAVNWGSDGMAFINADVDLVITRLPASTEVGLSAVDRSENDGIAVGTALLFDRSGLIGSASTIALANSDRRVDPANRRPDLSAFHNQAHRG